MAAAPPNLEGGVAPEGSGIRTWPFDALSYFDYCVAEFGSIHKLFGITRRLRFRPLGIGSGPRDGVRRRAGEARDHYTSIC